MTEAEPPLASPAALRDFWFGAPPRVPREAWFRRSDAFDEEIRRLFGATLDAGLRGALPPAWRDDPLAEIVLLDQLARNAGRGTARAFAGDGRALALAQAMVNDGADRALHPVARGFVYMPFEHAESAPMQDEAVRLFEAYAAEGHDTTGMLDYARRHRDVIRRFGRFPHRNLALGRLSTAEEAAYLAEPGSGF
jgi:uncharacterized protein (DUF924 family)